MSSTGSVFTSTIQPSSFLLSRILFIPFKMSQKVFFPPSFLGTNVDLADESTTNGMGVAHKSTWIVSKKLDEDVYQQDENSYLTFGPVSRSIATFLCHDAKASGDAKIMKIMMQSVYFRILSF